MHIQEEKEGQKTYYYVKGSVTSEFEKSCTMYLKHKVMQNRADNTFTKIYRILPYYINFLESSISFHFCPL